MAGPSLAGLMDYTTALMETMRGNKRDGGMGVTVMCKIKVAKEGISGLVPCEKPILVGLPKKRGGRHRFGKKGIGALIWPLFL